MNTTPNLNLPFILEAQAQKHVTHNEAIRALDALVQLSVVSQALSAPPTAPAEGARYIIAASATGVWIGKEAQIAAWQDGAWAYYLPLGGWQVWVEDEAKAFYFDGSAWALPPRDLTLLANNSPNSAQTSLEIAEEEITLSGAFTDSTMVIPNRAIVFAVSTRTIQAVTGASSYDCGISGETSKYGGSLGGATNSTNIGVTGPTPFYSDTAIRLTANTANFTGGKVRIAIHMTVFNAPTQ